MKTYIKTHTNKKALHMHRDRIKARGGVSTVFKENGVYMLTYSFPEKKVSNRKAAQTKSAVKKTAAKKTAKPIVPKRKRYDVISPDGFTIRIGVPPFTSITQRNRYFQQWKNRFKAQGYYSSVQHGKIDLLDLSDFCEWIEL